MLVTLLVLTPFAIALVVLSLPASRRRRVNAAAGGPPVSPARPEPAGGTAVPAAADLPEREERTAFAYDNGLKVGEAGNS